jgi:CBS domain-containing protein
MAGTSIDDPFRGHALRDSNRAGSPTSLDSSWRADASPPAAKEVRHPRWTPLVTVGEVMTRGPRSCRPDDTLAAAAVAMCDADCRFLPVVDRNGSPVGVVTDGDICLLGATDHRRLRDIFVREGMSGFPATCRKDDLVEDALGLMRQLHIRHLPVVDRKGCLEGVLSLTDLVLRAEESGSSDLRRSVAAALREITQKHGNRRTIQHNPFVED